jgi:hypothetical protein
VPGCSRNVRPASDRVFGHALSHDHSEFAGYVFDVGDARQVLGPGLAQTAAEAISQLTDLLLACNGSDLQLLWLPVLTSTSEVQPAPPLK